MSHRSPARFLAPLVLVAAAVTTFLVVRPELRGAPRAASPASTGAKSAKGTTATTRSSSSKAASAAKRGTTGATGAAGRTYTVQPGDVLDSISQSTGVSVADLQSYNEIDAQNLRVGQKLKLRP